MCSFLSRQAVTARDSVAKSLYGSLFDWIVLRINHALLNKKDIEVSIQARDSLSLSLSLFYLFICLLSQCFVCKQMCAIRLICASGSVYAA